jgi:uncharacterized protein YxjI
MAITLNEYLVEIQELTKKNFEILKALNNSFYTKSEHLRVNIDNSDYVIPSFISLENKINTLEDNFYNLVNAPKTGEAVFDFDGNTQSIEVKGFTNAPKKAFDGVDLNNLTQNMKSFEYKKNEIFKDFLTPTPYVKIDLSQIPNDIQQVNVKKLIIKNEQLLTLLKQESKWQTADANTGTSESICKHIEYSNVLKKLYAFEDGIDYTVYDKIYTMPIRYEIGNGKYSIKEIKRNWTDDNFNEHYELKLDHLTYKVADETIEKNIFEGDYLITNNDKVKLLIEKIYSSSNTVDVKVENGGFADLCTENEGNVDLSTLKFYAIGNIEQSKYLNIPLEEDRYVLIFLAPIQRNSLIQSPWGSGLFFDVYALQEKGSNTTFKDFYETMVTNIGDKLFGLVSMSTEDFVNVGETEFYKLTKSKPYINTDNIKVTLINKHMSNSETVSEIYNLYKQKEDYKLELNSVQKQIDEINSLLSSLSFEDTTTSRTIYTDQLSDLNNKKKDLTTSIADCIQRITIASTDTDTPVENPKYHIRGFFDYEKYLKDNGIDNHKVIKIDVQYRYKNANRVTGNAETIGEINGNPAIFSDWNIMQSFTSERFPIFDYSKYKYEFDGDTSSKNVPSFNQLDIPISQGETVDVRLRVVYAIGFPFIKTTSEWSDIVNIEFPVELRKNVTVLDIIKENNADTTKEAFRGYLEKYGVIEHVSDNLVDQNVTYFHQPEHIASGFYTEERRVIPLRDKLQTLTNEMTSLKDEVFGTSSENFIITLSDGESEVEINPHANNTFILKDYTSSDKITYMYDDDMNVSTGDVVHNGYNPKVETTLTLKIQNNSKTNTIKLFSMFPGNYNSNITPSSKSKFNNDDFISDLDTSLTDGNSLCVPLYLDSRTTLNDETPFISQVFNQWLYFRVKDAYNGELYYTDGTTNNGESGSSSEPGSSYSTSSLPDYYTNKIYGYCNDVDYTINEEQSDIIYPKFFSNESSKIANNGCGMCIFPHLTDIKDICITENDNINYKVIYPGEFLEIPITVMYYLDTNHQTVTKTMGFDLRNSLYSDPLNYKFDVVAKFSNSLSNNTRKIKKVRYNPVIIN